MKIQRPVRIALSGILGACALGFAVADENKPVFDSALTQCTTVAGRDDRLACYDYCATVAGRDDRLACYDSRAGRRPEAPQAQLSMAPAALDVPAAVSPSAHTPTKEDFGLSVLQARNTGNTPPQIHSIDALVSGIGQSASGRMLITLDNGQSWELDSPDVLLAAGSAVSIQRAALGSFMLTTSLKRTHRVHRIH